MTFARKITFFPKNITFLRRVKEKKITNVSKKHSLESFQFRFPNAINYKQNVGNKTQ